MTITRAVDGEQRAVGVLAEVLVARRVEQRHAAVAERELEDRGGDRDAALALDVHPVGDDVALRPAAAHGAGQLDGAAVEQQLLGERRLAGVRVRDDGERAAARGFGPPDGVDVGRGAQAGRRRCGQVVGAGHAGWCKRPVYGHGRAGGGRFGAGRACARLRRVTRETLSIRSLLTALVLAVSVASAGAQEGSVLPPVPTPTDVQPGSITCDECPYPYPSKYLDISVYDQDVRIAYMDVAPHGDGRTGTPSCCCTATTSAASTSRRSSTGSPRKGFRVIVPDQIGYGQSSKPIAPYNFNSQARNTWRILQHEKIEKAMIVGHSMGGMLTARFATQFPKAVERLVIYNPIGLTDGRFDRPMTPIDEALRSRT